MKESHTYSNKIFAGLTAVLLTASVQLRAEGNSPSKTAPLSAEKNLSSGRHVKMQWKKPSVKKRTGPVAAKGNDVESLSDRFPGAKAPVWKKADRKQKRN